MENPDIFIKEKVQDATSSIGDSLALPDEYIEGCSERGLEKQAEAYETVKRVCRVIHEAGGRALLVGGAVRDLLLHLDADIKDFDIEVYNLDLETLEDLLRPLGKMSGVGKSFAVHKLFLDNGVDIDISLPRRDSKTGSRHGDFSVDADPYMSISEAARRRDFTINAILADPLTGQIFDPFHGVEDLKQKTLRIVDAETFVDDPLRILRAMQFVGRFDLVVDRQSQELMSSMSDSLRHLSKERIYEEWRKLLLKSIRPSSGLQLGMDVGVFKALHPNFVTLTDTPQDPEKHPEGTVWEHTKLIVDNMADVARREQLNDAEMWPLMLAALCHDLGKAKTTTERDGKIIAHGHDIASVSLTHNFLDSMTDDKFVRSHVLPLVQHHMRPMHLFRDKLHSQEIKDSVFRRLARDLSPANIRELAFLSEADAKASLESNEEQIRTLVEWLVVKAESLGVDRQAAPDI